MNKIVRLPAEAGNFLTNLDLVGPNKVFFLKMYFHFFFQ